jgi:ubiquinone/menaquinone biosynthesis C-methylase UbiE
MTIEEMPPLPPNEYMQLVGGDDTFDTMGQSLVAEIERQGMLGEDVRFLDVGCGCGRAARYLLEKPLASYVGFDRHSGMIDWCRQEITSRFAKFDFLYFNIKSAYRLIDGHEGEMPATEFRFPFEDHAFDSVLLASVFTHMPMIEIFNYLNEIYRVLSPVGAALVSVFFRDAGKDTTNGSDFYLLKEDWLNALGMSRLHHTLVGIGGSHNWYVLRPFPIEFRSLRIFDDP